MKTLFSFLFCLFSFSLQGQVVGVAMEGGANFGITRSQSDQNYLRTPLVAGKFIGARVYLIFPKLPSYRFHVGLNRSEYLSRCDFQIANNRIDNPELRVNLGRIWILPLQIERVIWLRKGKWALNPKVGISLLKKGVNMSGYGVWSQAFATYYPHRYTSFTELIFNSHQGFVQSQGAIPIQNQKNWSLGLEVGLSLEYHFQNSPFSFGVHQTYLHGLKNMAEGTTWFEAPQIVELSRLEGRLQHNLDRFAIYGSLCYQIMWK
ncbi:hypothetical protein [Hugenholtzia roseola]|uniref:hypothetical protein n=1 Tax=Hugenholtzia roseola TaxID=1002 RepID=UPI00054DB4EA|nr:hypothetical protein [Hugenholtzia roseola]